MRYDYEFKLECIAKLRTGKRLETPEGTTYLSFRRMVREWSAIERYCGPEALRPKLTCKIWALEEKLNLIYDVLAGIPVRQVAVKAGIDHTMLRRWVNRYKIENHDGFYLTSQINQLKRISMKKLNYNNPRKREETEHEELIRLRAENEYIKAEIEIIKKEIALREEREAAQLKAKKQLSSKNSMKKDTN